MISVKIGCLRSSLFPSDASAIYSVTVYVHFTFSYNRFRNKNGVVLIVTKERIISRTVLFHIGIRVPSPFTLVQMHHLSRNQILLPKRNASEPPFLLIIFWFRGKYLFSFSMHPISFYTEKLPRLHGP